jgi:hypothetical protein
VRKKKLLACAREGRYTSGVDVIQQGENMSSEREIGPDGIHTNLDGVGVHHRVFLPSSWDRGYVEVLIMVDEKDDQPHVEFGSGSIRTHFILSNGSAPELRDLARALSASADVLEGKRT